MPGTGAEKNGNKFGERLFHNRDRTGRKPAPVIRGVPAFTGSCPADNERLGDTKITRRLSVLIVEDEAVIALELEDMLRASGHAVLAVTGTLDHALAAVDRLKGELDAAVLDANLAGQSVLPVAEALRDHGIPFIVTSGYDNSELRLLGLDAPCVAKPYDSAVVEAAIHTLFASPA